jgi:rhodanese-related sulfurtransferase
MVRSKFTLWFLLFFIVMFCASIAGAAGFTLVTKDQLKDELTKPDVTVIDVRIPGEWDSAQMKIQGARRESPAEVPQWVAKYPKDKTIVLYCA